MTSRIRNTDTRFAVERATTEPTRPRKIDIVSYGERKKVLKIFLLLYCLPKIVSKELKLYYFIRQTSDDLNKVLSLRTQGNISRFLLNNWKISYFPRYDLNLVV